MGDQCCALVSAQSLVSNNSLYDCVVYYQTSEKPVLVSIRYEQFAFLWFHFIL